MDLISEDDEASSALDSHHLICDIGALIFEGRLPPRKMQSSSKSHPKKPYFEGPHCPFVVGGVLKKPVHLCQKDDPLCLKYLSVKSQLLRKEVALEVFIAPDCICSSTLAFTHVVAGLSARDDLLLEQWRLKVINTRSQEQVMSVASLYQAVRSSLHFSQLAAWYTSTNGMKPLNVVYSVGPLLEASRVDDYYTVHNFPLGYLDQDKYFQISVASLPRIDEIPSVPCLIHNRSSIDLSRVNECRFMGSTLRKGKLQIGNPVTKSYETSAGAEILDGLADLPNRQLLEHSKDVTGAEVVIQMQQPINPFRDVVRKNKEDFHGSSGDTTMLRQSDKQMLVDDRMQITCAISGKHHCDCELAEDSESCSSAPKEQVPRRRRSLSRVAIQDLSDSVDSYGCVEPERILHGKFKEVHCEESSSSRIASKWSKLPHDFTEVMQSGGKSTRGRHSSNYVPCHFQLPFTISPNSSSQQHINGADDFQWDKSNPFLAAILRCTRIIPEKRQRITCDSSINTDISFAGYPPTAIFMPTVRASADRPTKPIDCLGEQLRDARCQYSLLRYCPPKATNPVSAPTEDSTESEGSSAANWKSRSFHSICSRNKLSTLLPLRGSYEENLLQGRFIPASTVDGFTLKLCASGSFFPKHQTLPASVNYYSLQDCTVSAPYTCAVHLGKKGYRIPRSGTVQATLFNPQKTVVRMFVVRYECNDMPANSCTLVRQRTLCELLEQEAKAGDTTAKNKAEGSEGIGEDNNRFSKYLIQLSFSMTKSRKLYLSSEIKLVISNKFGGDRAHMMEGESLYNTHVQTLWPINPKYSVKN